VSDLILQVGRFLFEQPPDQQIPLDQLYRALPDYDQVTIGDVLHRMHMQHLIEATFQNDPIRLSRDGREAWNDGSIVELTLGIQYVCDRYGPATVHVVVMGVNGEFGGSGFFSADYPDRIVTAAHVLRGKNILHIDNLNGQVIAEPPFIAVIPENEDDVDLALIQCNCPVGINPIRIEWRDDAIRGLEPLIVLGYPPLPNLRPGLDHIRAELRQIAPNFRDERDSLVISSVTLPGSSGGPVLTRRGRAVGVVEQQNIGEYQGQNVIQAFTATPARYLTKLREPTPDAL
jgi:hypothetical protein